MMKNLLATIVFLIFFSLASAQVVDQDVKSARDQVIADDLIVQGSECVGMDCANGINFGFETVILRENNTRLKFDDTSNSGSFPANDWQLEANESSNGGRNHFAIVDATAGRKPFIVVAGARNNALVVGSNSGVGVGTDQPIGSAIHEKFGNTPTLRLEQDQSNGFTAQTWDLAGNEANFFIRDVTNGSKLPFRIKPGAPEDALFIAANGDIGLGTENPSARLDVKGNILIPNSSYNLSLRSDGSTAHQTFGLDGNNDLIINRSAITADQSSGVVFGMTSDRIFDIRDQDNNIFVRLRGSDGFLGIGTPTPTNALTLQFGDAAKPGGGSWLATSDKRAKMNVRPFEDGLEEVLEINPVYYKYNGKFGTHADNSEYVGVIAQEMQEIAPYTVKDTERRISSDLDSGSEKFLSFDASPLPYMLINAVKEQQTLIEDQRDLIEEQSEKITELEASLVELRNMIEDLQQASTTTINGSELGYLGQNIPNPYSGETTIKYVVPSTSQQAELRIFGMDGNFIKAVPIKHTGKGELRLSAQNLPAGTYSYQLLVDGKHMGTKKMILKQ